jgi:nucleotide-binding universal stress UspA family protein
MLPESFFRLRLLEKHWPLGEEGIEPKFLVQFGPAETLILEAAEQHGIQLLVLSVPGTGHPDLAAHLPGHLAYNVVSHALCPVFAVREIVKPEPQQPVNP